VFEDPEMKYIVFFFGVPENAVFLILSRFMHVHIYNTYSIFFFLYTIFILDRLVTDSKIWMMYGNSYMHKYIIIGYSNILFFGVFQK